MVGAEGRHHVENVTGELMAYVPLREQDSKKSQGKPGKGGIGLGFCSDPPGPPPVE